jgi:nicotinamidase-related amidase
MEKIMKSRFLCSTIALAAALLAGGPILRPAQAADVVDEWANVKAPPAPELKPVTVDPKTTALLLMDFLPKFYCADKPRCVASLPALSKLLAAARASGTTVIYSIAGTFTLADTLKDVAPLGNEPYVKAHADKFLDTDLDKILKDKGIQTVIVTGTAGNGAVLYTGSEAAIRGFNVIVPVDGLPSESPYAEQFTIWQLAHGPGFGKQVTITRSDMIKF